MQEYKIQEKKEESTPVKPFKSMSFITPSGANPQRRKKRRKKKKREDLPYFRPLKSGILAYYYYIAQIINKHRIQSYMLAWIRLCFS